MLNIKKQNIRVSVVSYLVREMGYEIKCIYLLICAKKYRKDKRENNEIGYLQRVGENRMERMGELKQKRGMIEVTLLRVYPFIQFWLLEPW